MPATSAGLGQKIRAIVEPLPAVVEWMESRRALSLVLASAFLVVKLIVVARGDLSTATAILRTTGVGTVVLGGLITALPIVLSVILAIAFYRLCFEPPPSRRLCPPGAVPMMTTAPDHGPDSAARVNRESQPPRTVRNRLRSVYGALWIRSDTFRPAAALVVFSSSAAALAVPWPVAVTAAVLGATTGRLRKSAQATPTEVRPRSRRRPIWPAHAALALALMTVGYMSFRLLYSVWLPHERIQLVGQPEEIGYVLDDSGPWIAILRTGQRKVVHYPQEEVQTRTLCQAPVRAPVFHPDSYFTPVQLLSWQLLDPTGHPPGLPACPTGRKD
jgi:hypothetical protein